MDAKPASLVMIDGEIVAPERAVVSVFDRGFLYGDSVFEVLRTYERKPFALEEHLARLFESSRRVALSIPVSLSELKDEVLRAIAQAPDSDVVVRLQVTRGSGPLGLDPSQARAPLRVVILAPLSTPPVEDYRGGIGVALVRTERTADNTSAAGAKVANYLVALLALREAQAQGAKEAIILDGRGRVLEGTTSNVFLIKDNTLMTPPESEGILSGITRKRLLQAAAGLSLPVRITTLTRGDLFSADEVFLSSTLREVLPVARIDGQAVGEGGVGPTTRAIHRRFRADNGLPSAMPWE